MEDGSAYYNGSTFKETKPERRSKGMTSFSTVWVNCAALLGFSCTRTFGGNIPLALWQTPSLTRFRKKNHWLEASWRASRLGMIWSQRALAGVPSRSETPRGLPRVCPAPEERVQARG